MRLKSYLRGIGIGVAVTALILHFSGSGKNGEMSDAQIRARAAELGMVERMTLAETGNGQEGEKPTAPPRAGEDPTEAPTEPTQDGGETDPTETPEVTPEVTEEPTEEATGTPTPEPTATPTPEPTATPTPEPTATPTPEPTEAPTPEPTEAPTPEPTAPEPTEAPTPEVTEAPAAANVTSGFAINTEDAMITVRSGEGSLTVARRLVEAGVVSSAKELDDYLCRHGYDRKICTGAHVIPAGASYEEIGKIITTRTDR